MENIFPEADIHSGNQEIPHLLRNPIFHYHIQKNPGTRPYHKVVPVL
jgi:hypothetical protein